MKPLTIFYTSFCYFMHALINKSSLPHYLFAVFVIVDEKASELISLPALKEPFFSRKILQLIKILSAFRLVLGRGDRVLECLFADCSIKHVRIKEMNELSLALLSSHLTKTRCRILVQNDTVVLYL